MKYNIDDPHRTPEWYYQAGESMAKKVFYLDDAIRHLTYQLEDPTKTFPWHARKEMQADKGRLQAAIKRIMETYKERVKALEGHPEHLREFKRGFYGS